MPELRTLPVATALPAPAAANARVARFYDWVGWLYPLFEVFGATGRRRLITLINAHSPGRLLEIGVGPGVHLPLYRSHAITAIDCSAQMVARSRLQRPDADIHQMDGERLGFPNGQFDYVVLCHVLSVTTHPEHMLAEAHRVLRRGGRLFVLNHETPTHAWRHVEAAITPLARWLCFRSQFRLDALAGVRRFRRQQRLELGAGWGLMQAYSLQK